MYYAILTHAGKITDLVCDPAEIDQRCHELNGVLIAQAETAELYKKRCAQDLNGQTNWV